MAQTPAQKLRIKEGMVLRTWHAPGNFRETLGDLPPNVTISPDAAVADQVHWFVPNQARLEEELDGVINMISGTVVCWIYYPKGSSGMQTDLTRDKGWDKLLAHQEMQWINLISFDNTWSAFGFRLKAGADKAKEEKPAMREIFKYADATQKTIQLPEDLEKALDQNKEAAAYFATLSFSNKKEYVEWIVTAKKEDTRKTRIAGTLERLQKGWKNPRNI